MKVWIFACLQDRDQQLMLLKCTPCPHCRHTGALNRHGFLRGYDQHNVRQKTVRALRVFCSNRRRHQGCGRTFSVWLAERIKRLFLDAHSLWEFLLETANSGNKSKSFAGLKSPLSESAPWRIWRRFRNAQSRIRTALLALGSAALTTSQAQATEHSQGSPPSSLPEAATIDHLQQVFKASNLNPIAAFQLQTQSFFI